MQITKSPIAMRDNLGVDNPRYVARCEEHGRCPKHPAYEPDNCPVCGTAQQIGRDT
jgi:hypothetical protein